MDLMYVLEMEGKQISQESMGCVLFKMISKFSPHLSY